MRFDPPDDRHGRSPVRRVVLPLQVGDDQHLVLPPATVLTAWFGASLQIVSDDEERLESLESLAQSLGIPVEPTIVIPEPFDESLIRHVDECAPSLVVTTSSPAARAFAERAGQPVLLVGNGKSRRFPNGPILVEVTGRDDDRDSIVVAATYATAIGGAVRLVPGPGLTDNPEAVATEALSTHAERLRQMGCEVEIEDGPTDDRPLVSVGRAAKATAAVIPAARVDDEVLLDEATERGVNLLVAPRGQVGSSAERKAAAPSPLTLPLRTMSDAECLERLRRHGVARLGYVEDGSPMVVPVNYRFAVAALYLRSVPGGKLRAAERGDEVCLQLDGTDSALREGWSILVHGRLEIASDPATLRDAWENDPAPWVRADAWHWLRLTPSRIGGRLLSHIDPGHSPSASTTSSSNELAPNRNVRGETQPGPKRSSTSCR